MTRIKLVALSLVLLLVAGTAATWVVQANRRASAEAAYPPDGRLLDIDGVQVHAHVRGQGPDLVLLHGAFGSFRDFTFDLVGRLEDRYRVIAFDRPGAGYTGHTDPKYARAFAAAGESPEEQAALLAKAAEALGVETPIVVGHSFGGIVALAWALNHDPAAVVLLGGVSMPWPGDLGPIYQVNGTALGGGLVAPLISAWVPMTRLETSVEAAFAPQPMPEGYGAHIGPYMPTRLPAFRATTRQVNTLRPHVVEMSTRYDELTLPIEILHGTADTSVPLRTHAGPFSEKVPSANLTTLEGVGHMPHHADPESAVAAIDRAAARARP